MAAGEGAHRGLGRAEGVQAAGAVHPRAALDELTVAQPGERFAQLVRGGDDEVLEVDNRLRAGLHRAGPGVAQYADRLDDPVTALWHGSRLAAEHAASGRFSVACVVLTEMAAADSDRSCDLDHLDALEKQSAGVSPAP